MYGKGRIHFFHQEPGPSCGIAGDAIYLATSFVWNRFRTFSEKYFPTASESHKILVDFRRDARILVHKSRLKFNFQVFCRVIISHRTQNTGLDGLSFQEYHHSPTRALNG